MNKNFDDKMDLRRKNLQRYKDQSGDEWQRIGKKTGFSPSHLSQIISGHRPFTEKTARKLEPKLALSAGWLDLEHDISRPGQPSQNGDEGLLVRVIGAIDIALKAAGKADIKGEAKYGRLVEFAYEDSKERGMPPETWYLRLVKLILD